MARQREVRATKITDTDLTLYKKLIELHNTVDSGSGNGVTVIQLLIQTQVATIGFSDADAISNGNRS